MNINPQTTPAIYPNHNAGDFSAAFIDGDEAAFDSRLEQLLEGAKAEREAEQQARKAEKLAAGEKWLQQYPLLNKMVAGGIINPDKGTSAVMQPSYESRGDSFDVAPDNDALLDAALGLSQSTEVYGGHPEQVTDSRRNETLRAVARAATVKELESPADAVEMPHIQEALKIGVAINTLRGRAEGLYLPDNYKKDDFGLAA